MAENEKREETLFYAQIFPVKCGKCEMTYSSEADILIAFARQEGVFSLDDIIEKIKTSQRHSIFLKCPCGETIVVPFKERRGATWAKTMKRQLFGEKMKELMNKKGMTKEQARDFLLKKLFRGNDE